MNRWMFVVFLSGGCVAVATAQTAASPERTAITRYCVACHNSKVKTGGLSLDAADVHNPAAQSEAWEKVVRKLRTRSMPPAGLPRPDEKTYVALLSSIESSLDKAAAAKPNPGRTDTFRRLNRTEYQNAIRDLLAIESMSPLCCPATNPAMASTTSPSAIFPRHCSNDTCRPPRKISRLAVGQPCPLSGGDTVTLPPDLTQEEHFEELPLGTRGGSTVKYTFPLDAEYDIQIRLARDRNEHVEGFDEPRRCRANVRRRAGAGCSP